MFFFIYVTLKKKTLMSLIFWHNMDYYSWEAAVSCAFYSLLFDDLQHINFQ